MHERNIGVDTASLAMTGSRGRRRANSIGAPLFVLVALGVASTCGPPPDPVASPAPAAPVAPAPVAPVDPVVPPVPVIPVVSVVPGLAGYGVTTPAGRGGAILKVTTLADHGPGSLRDALTTAGPRIIVFEVGGTINLDGPLIVKEPFFTLAGQTAPEPGITIRGYHMSIRTHDGLIQHIRVRPGDIHAGDPEGISIYQPGGLVVHHIVVDHTSTSWAIDENTNTWSATAAAPGPDAGVHDVTFSNNLIGEGLDNSTHPKGPHSKGMLIGDGSERIAVVRNVFVDNADRNPEMTGGTSAIVVNNLIYGWDPKQEATHFGRAGTVREEPTCASVVGNSYIRSPSMGTGPAAAVEVHRDLPPGSMLFVTDNVSPGIEPIRNESMLDPFVAGPPVWVEGLQVEPASSLAGPLLVSAGARPFARDAVDLRLVNDVRDMTGKIIDSQKQVGGWPVLELTVRPLVVPDDPNGDADADGYTNVEEWLQGFAALVETGTAVPPPALVGATFPVNDDPRCV